jgi:hypothetical protein
MAGQRPTGPAPWPWSEDVFNTSSQNGLRARGLALETRGAALDGLQYARGLPGVGPNSAFYGDVDSIQLTLRPGVRVTTAADVATNRAVTGG